ncbi:MAG: methylated-DNA--[protein]-cysteine S-methyltransferase [Acidobacteria bacterium]|nr:methylated-DNA--[protein]-cysteine S-methyltransferase [Acidobacteriota bacterium]
MLWFYELDGPLGPMNAAFDGRGKLRQLGFGGLDPRKTTPLAPKEQREAWRFLRMQMEAYWGGNLRTFTVPLAPEGTEFQMRVWDELLKIPYGQTISYLDLARRLGDEKATRAVAAANGANPIAILVPCHRVVGSDGTLTGYAGGKDKKAFLLNLERGLPLAKQLELGLE